MKLSKLIESLEELKKQGHGTTIAAGSMSVKYFFVRVTIGVPTQIVLTIADRLT